MRINITLSVEDLRELDRQAFREGRTRSAHIRELMKLYKRK
jgi:metal-responsive CopG/Arc/MetJ family transcriptional regulator